MWNAVNLFSNIIKRVPVPKSQIKHASSTKYNFLLCIGKLKGILICKDMYHCHSSKIQNAFNLILITGLIE
jgi:hypothetical protein